MEIELRLIRQPLSEFIARGKQRIANRCGGQLHRLGLAFAQVVLSLHNKTPAGDRQYQQDRLDQQQLCLELHPAQR